AEDGKKLDLVFAGYGIDAPNYSDYQNLDVKGKTAVVLAGEPVNAQGNYVVHGNQTASNWGSDYRSKLRAASAKGAKNLIIVSTDSEAKFQSNIDRLKHWLEAPSLRLPEKKDTRAAAVFVNQQAGAALLGTNTK